MSQAVARSKLSASVPHPMEDDILRALEGQPLDSHRSQLCDFTLEDQNAALESQGVRSKSIEKDAIIGDTVNYIVAAVLFGERGEVLLIQEAKESCAGKWYLPAGRLNRGEDVVTAVKREVLEETGLEMECVTLIMVESAKGYWIRFVLTGDVVAGTLKTPAQADKESLQAKWISNLDEVTLRSRDVIPLIERGREFYEARRRKDQTWHKNVLPAMLSHKKMLLRLLVAIKEKGGSTVHFLVSERDAVHLPVCEIHPNKSLHSTLRRFMVEIFGADVAQHRPHGVVSVEFNSEDDNDGVCITMLVAFKATLEEVPIIGKCSWQEATKKLGEKIMVRVAACNSTIPLNVIS